MSTNDCIAEKEYIIRRVLHMHFMVDHICSKYKIELDDLMQVGRIGLWEARKKFRPMENGLSFDSYAHRIVNLKLLEYLRHLRRPIRKTDYSESINVEIFEGVEIIETIKSETNLENQALDRVYLEEVYSDFNKQEKSFFQQRMTGYSYREIQNNLGIKGKKFKDIREKMVLKIKKKNPLTAISEL